MVLTTWMTLGSLCRFSESKLSYHEVGVIMCSSPTYNAILRVKYICECA